MEIYGRNYGFALTVGSADEISKIAPGGQIASIVAVLRDEGAPGALETRIGFISAMSRGWADQQRFREPGSRAEPLTPEMLRSLPIISFQTAFAEAIGAFVRDLETTVGIKRSKKAGDAAAAPGASR